MGSGRFMDGQVLIAPEMLGMGKVTHYYNKLYDTFEERTLRAMGTFVKEVVHNQFPAEPNCRHITEDQSKAINELLKQIKRQ
ncbi:MAG: 3-methyl-2-oxobutanoate hydroxymethyltransferase [Thermodesulfobacteriota bacterium]